MNMIVPRYLTMPERIIDGVWDRDGGRCVCCGNQPGGPHGEAWEVHIRRPLTRTRAITPSNVVLLCGIRADLSGCFGAVEDRPDLARARGLILWRSQIPAEVAVGVALRPTSLAGSHQQYALNDYWQRMRLTIMTRSRLGRFLMGEMVTVETEEASSV